MFPAKGAAARVFRRWSTRRCSSGRGQSYRKSSGLGWIGTHSTFPYLESIFPVLGDLARRHKFRLKVVGAGKERHLSSRSGSENSAWEIDREVEDFQSIDIGLYPIDASLYSGWASGKSGFKAVQYMAVGVPYVATPVADRPNRRGRNDAFVRDHE